MFFVHQHFLFFHAVHVAGVTLKLSTAEPSILRTPPALANKTVSFRVNDPKPVARRPMVPPVAATAGVSCFIKTSLLRYILGSES